MKKLTKTIFALIVLAAPLFFTACEEETTFSSTEDNTRNSSTEELEDEDILD